MTRPRPAAALLAAAAAVLAPGCARDEPPATAYRALVEAVRTRDEDRAFGLLAPQSQAWLEARAKAAAARAPGVVPASGKDLLLGTSSAGLRPPRSVVPVRESADRAILQVTGDDGAVREVELVKAGRWRVVVPEP
jgi:hypothetical protein